MYERDSKSGNILSSMFSKRGRHRFAAFATAVCMVLSALTALFMAAPVVDAVEDDHVQIKVGTILKPDDFNPFSMTTGISYMIAWMMYELLYTIGPDMEPCPQLAQSHEASPDGTVWTYHLAEDSVWHDGVPVTAHDVAFTFNMIMDNRKDTTLLRDYLNGFVYPVVATDDHTVQITLEEPKATMLSISVPILPEHLWTDVVADGKIKTVSQWDTSYFPDGPVGSGPMILDEYDEVQGFIRLMAQDPYHRLEGIEVDSINVDEVLFVIYDSESAMTRDLETGAIHVVDGVPEFVWETVLDYPNVEGQSPGALDLTEAGFNCASRETRESVYDDGTGDRKFPEASDNYETCNLSVRQAITMATNRTEIVDKILQNLAEEADSLIPIATDFWHYDVPEEEKFHFDIEAANDLLNESGYHQFDGSDFGFAGVRENESSGARLEFDFYYIRSTTRDQLTAGKMALWCEDIGVKLNLIGESEGTLYGIWFNMGYDMFIWNWQPDVDPTFLLSVLTTDQIPEDHLDSTAWSDAFYSNPVYDQMYLDQQLLMDKPARQAMVHEMQQIVHTDCPYICLWYPLSLIAYRTDSFTNYPDMVSYVGTTPDSIWFYFEITPIGGVAPVNEPPYDVDAGVDATIYVGDIQGFSGSAEDLESPQEDLNWTWVIDEDGVETTLDGQIVSHTFDIVGTFEVTLTVEDPEGASDSDSLTVTVEEIPEGGIGWITGYVEDTAGDPIVGALVTVIDESSESADELGMYNISVEPGAYELVASADGYSDDTASVSVEKDVVSWSNFTLGMTSGSVTGQVLDSVTEEGVADALVELFESGEEDASYSKKTDVEGSFEIVTVDEGTYEVVVSRTGFETNDTESITVTVGETATLVIYLNAADEEKDAGMSTTAIAAIAALAIIAAVAAAALLLKRKKGSEPEIPKDESPSEQTTEPPET